MQSILDGVASPRPPAPCAFCGEDAVLELAEAWPDHAFLLETCCLASHEAVCHGMADDPEWARGLLRRLGAEDLFGGGRLRRVADGGRGQMLLDWNLVVRPVAFAAAADFVRRHHAHCGAPTAWRFGASVANGPTLLGVAMVGNPVARAFNGRGVVEVNRLCLRRDAPRALAWNAASKLYGWAAAEARRRGFAKIITYTRADEAGTFLVAAGWAREAAVRGRGWHRAGGRARSDRNAWIDKVRWGRALSPPVRGPARHATGHGSPAPPP